MVKIYFISNGTAPLNCIHILHRSKDHQIPKTKSAQKMTRQKEGHLMIHIKHNWNLIPIEKTHCRTV